MSRTTWFAALLAAACAPHALAANDITVTATGGGTATVNDSAGTVVLTAPGTFTIEADEDSTTTVPNDGYINSITLHGSAATGTYTVRIAHHVSGDLYTNGARFVGYADITDGDRRGNLQLVLIDGYWGRKIVSGNPVDTDPDTEITRLYHATPSGLNGARFVVSGFDDDTGSGTVTAGARIIVGVSGNASSQGWNLDVTTFRDFNGTLETASREIKPDSVDIGRDLTGTIKSLTQVRGEWIIRRDLTGSIIANVDGDAVSTAPGNIHGRIIVKRHLSGEIRALEVTSVGGGEVLNDIEVAGDFSGLVESQGPLDTNAWVRFNYDGVPPGDWDTGGEVKIDGTTYTAETTPPRCIWSRSSPATRTRITPSTSLISIRGSTRAWIAAPGWRRIPGFPALGRTSATWGRARRASRIAGSTSSTMIASPHLS